VENTGQFTSMKPSRDPSPERVREALYELLDGQLSDPSTPDVREQYERLLGLGIAEAEVRRMMASAIAIFYYKTMRGGNYSYIEYLSYLSNLPESEEAVFGEAGDDGESVEDEDEEPALTEVRPLRRRAPSRVNTTDLMNDPFYSPILYMIERAIAVRDREAQGRSVIIKDSQVRSILNKVRKKAEGGSPKIPSESERDNVLAAIFEDVIQARGEIQVEEADGTLTDLPVRDWILAVRSVEDSIRLRSSGPGSREYLNFLDGFVKEGEEAK